MPPRPTPARAVAWRSLLPSASDYAPASNCREAVNAAEASVSAKLGISQAQLPQAAKDAIRFATDSAIISRSWVIVQRDVEAALKSVVYPSARPMEILGDRMAAARQGVQAIAQDA